MGTSLATEANSPALEPRYRRGSGITNPVDVLVGKRIRMRRLLLGMKLDMVAKEIGISAQQVQKYEHGTNRISASNLVAVAGALQVPVSYFFADVERPDSDASPPIPIDMAELETIELIRLYHAIRDKIVRAQALQIVRAMAEASSPLPEALKRGRGRPIGSTPKGSVR